MDGLEQEGAVDVGIDDPLLQEALLETVNKQLAFKKPHQRT
jgi:hypothetical protein